MLLFAVLSTVLAGVLVTLLMLAVLDSFLAGATTRASEGVLPAQTPLVVGIGRVPGGPSEWDSFMVAFGCLEEDLGMPVVVRLLSDEQGTGAAFASREVDIAMIPVSAYLRLAEQGSVVPMAAPLVAGTDDNHAMLVVRQDSPYTTIAELRGARVALKPDSLAGGGYARWLLEQEGETVATFFGSLEQSDSQYGALAGLVRGDADAAFVPRWDLFGWPDDTFRKLAESPSFAMPPVVARSDLDAELIERIRISLTSTGTAAALPERRILSGFATVTDEEYAFARVLLEYKRIHAEGYGAP